ncbi:hypothetical protein ABK040_008393 [Willaertia magna]
MAEMMELIPEEQLVAVARECCELATEEIKFHYANTNKQFETKSTAIDLVTQTDKRVEEIIIENIKKNYPNHFIISEESSTQDNTNLNENGYTWIIDPIDGTTNFVHKFPYICISIGISYKGKLIIGVVYSPILDELFYGIKGKGSYFKSPFTNNEFIKIKTNPTKEINKSLLSSNYPYGRTEEILKEVELKYGSFLRKGCRGIRGTGSAVMNMCYVANGSLDAYFENGIQIWDISAGKVIVEEAGGIVCDPCELNVENENTFLNNHRCLCCCNVELANEMIQVLKKVEEECKQ